MKIAYLITAYDNPKQLARLVNALDADNVYFFIHIDKKSKYKFNLIAKPNIYIEKNNIEVYWGSYTFILAVVNLLSKALTIFDPDYICLLSGTDYPVRSNMKIAEFFSQNKGKEFLNIIEMPMNDKPLFRVHSYYFSIYDKSLNLKFLAKRILNVLIRKSKIIRKLPSKYKKNTLYAGSNWWAISRECAEYILSYVSNEREFVNFYKHTLIPEEMFFHTIIGNSKFKNNIVNSITFSDWPRQNLAHPVQINIDHINKLVKSNMSVDTVYGKSNVVFVRKFDDSSSSIIEHINKLRNE